MKKDSKQRLFEVMQRVDPSFKRKLNESYLNEGEANSIDIVLDFPKNTSSINTNGQVLVTNFPLTEEGLYNALYPIYTAQGKRYYNLIEVAYTTTNGKTGQYEMDIMLPDAQNQKHVILDLKDNIEELFVEIYSYSK